MQQQERSEVKGGGRRPHCKGDPGKGSHLADRRTETELVYLETDKAGSVPHEHVAIFDGQGNGVTTSVLLISGRGAAGHSHEIHGLELLAASDGHTHELTHIRAEPIDYAHYRRLICGARAREEEEKCEH